MNFKSAWETPMTTRRLFIILALTLGLAALAAFATRGAQMRNMDPGAPPQSAAQPPVHFYLSEDFDLDKTSVAFKDAFDAALSRTSPYVADTPHLPDKDDPTGVIVRLHSSAPTDTQAVVIVVFTVHFRGSDAEIYVGLGHMLVDAEFLKPDAQGDTVPVTVVLSNILETVMDLEKTFPPSKKAESNSKPGSKA